jgi:hypothetical protein
MPRQSLTPTITKSMFDKVEAPLRAALKDWWKDEAQDFDAAIAGTVPIWEGLPEIDSKAVVKASPIIKRFTGADLDPQMIRQGGYKSFDDLADDLLPKIRTACPSSTREDLRQSTSERAVEALHARKR